MTSAGQGSSAFRRAGKLLIQLLVTAAVTWFILRAVDFRLEELKAFDMAGLEIHWGLLAASTVLLLVAYVFSASLWGRMIREIGGQGVAFLPALRVFFTANLGRYIPGKLWQIAGLAYLAREEGVPAGTATCAAVLGQAFSLAGATLVGTGVLLRGGGSEGLGKGWPALALLAVLLAAASPGILKGVLRLWFRLAKQEVPSGFAPDAAFGIRWMGLYAIGWLIQGTAFWILVRSLGMGLTLLEGVPSFPAAYVAGYLALFSPAGVGIREGMLVVFLGPILGAGAAVAALVARLWSTLAELLPAVPLAGGYLKLWAKGEHGGV